MIPGLKCDHCGRTHYIDRDTKERKPLEVCRDEITDENLCLRCYLSDRDSPKDRNER